MVTLGERSTTMTPTLLGRWQLRLVLLIIQGSLITLLLWWLFSTKPVDFSSVFSPSQEISTSSEDSESSSTEEDSSESTTTEESDSEGAVTEESSSESSSATDAESDSEGTTAEESESNSLFNIDFDIDFDLIKAFLILAYVIVIGFLWDIIYQFIQSFRWDRDWPHSFQFIAGIVEGVAIWFLIKWNILPWLNPEDITLVSFLVHYGLIFLVTYLTTKGPLQILFPRWRFQGGQFW